MKTIQFKCTLLSDVIVNRKSASEGPNSTLDFIPGNNFLGIAAARYDGFGEDAFEVFHSGHVRFGDAHPAGRDGYRSLRSPASFFVPKLQTEDKTYYNYHLITDPASSEVKSLQLKQCRSGFYDFSKNPPLKCDTPSQFAIKSAYDSENRRSKDGALFGYEALHEGLVLYFEVEADDERLLKMVSDCLTGEKHLGRSRSAQYGLVRIEPCSFRHIGSTGEGFEDNLFSVYADGRLIFTDGYGMPSFRPGAKDLGFPEDARVIWEKSQIRTFQYAPYNGIRKTFDADRCGIEKGSVFIVYSPSGSPSESAYVGDFRNEGFGRIIYNPAFLASPSFIEGRAGQSIPVPGDQKKLEADPSDSTLVKLLKERHNQEVTMTTIYKVVNQWSDGHRGLFSDESFASQWGGIRSIATRERNYKRLMDALFSPDKEHPGYLMHGVAEAKWKERRRRYLLESFIKERNRDIPGYEWLAVVNLASVMAKISKKN